MIGHAGAASGIAFPRASAIYGHPHPMRERLPSEHTTRDHRRLQGAISNDPCHLESPHKGFSATPPPVCAVPGWVGDTAVKGAYRSLAIRLIT